MKNRMENTNKIGNNVITAKLEITPYAEMGAKGKALLYERQKEAVTFCNNVGRNTPSIRKRFYNIKNKNTVNRLADTVVEYCDSLGKEQDITTKGGYVDYLLTMKKYYSNVKESKSLTLKFLNEEPANVSNQGSPAGSEPGSPTVGGKRKYRKTRGKKQIKRRRLTKRR